MRSKSHSANPQPAGCVAAAALDHFIASGEMAYAYFSAHQPTAFWPIDNGGEAAVLFCFGFFLLVFVGGGSIALDNVVRRKSVARAG